MDHTVPHPELYRVPLQTEDFNGMPYCRLGRSGLRVSAVGLGTWKFGLPETGDNARVDERTAFAVFDRAVELGVTFWDTANRYNDASGNSERLIGRWLKAHPNQRRDIVIATKVFGGMDGRTPNHCRLSFDILAGERAAEQRGVLDYCAQRGFSYVAWSPLARGLLTDRYLDPGQIGAGDRLFDEGTLERDTQAAAMTKVRRLAEVAHAAGLALNQLALAYMLTLPGMGPVIPGASTVAQLESNARAGTVTLTAEQIAEIRSILESRDESG